MRQLLFLLVFLILSVFLVNAQKIASSKELTEFLTKIDSQYRFPSFVIKDTTTDFLLNETAWYTDSTNKVVLVQHTVGNHIGRVSGHRVQKISYYYSNDSLIVVADSNDVLSLNPLTYVYVFSGNERPAGMAKRKYTFYIKKASLLLQQYKKFGVQ